jgi:2-C-methyl-D-erythritol 2,4-cyclodiphosphate synthase
MNSSSTVKTILFWMSIILLGIMLWKLVSSNGTSSRANEISYNEFMSKVEAGEIKEVTMYLSQTSYELVGQEVRSPNRSFHLTLFKEAAPSVTEHLREKGVQVKVKEVRSADWVPLLLNGLPLLLLVGFCLFLMRRMKSGGQRALGAWTTRVRSGIGYDLHRLEEGRPLIVGGIELPFDKGPVGHSDGDVLAHALCDALLGAAGLGDIGTHFPDTDPQWKGANSLLFLEHAKKLLADKNFAIEHVDAVVITEKPKLGQHFPKMREALAKALGVSVDHIHLKAKTNEGVDAIGRGEAIAAHVVATLSSR